MIMMIALSPGLHVGDYVPVLVKKKEFETQVQTEVGPQENKMDGWGSMQRNG
jgi:hypothetical protein